MIYHVLSPTVNKSFDDYDEASDYAHSIGGCVYCIVSWYEAGILELKEHFGETLEILLDDSKRNVDFEDEDVTDRLDIEFHTTAGILRRLNVLAGYFKGEARVRNHDIGFLRSKKAEQ